MNVQIYLLWKKSTNIWAKEYICQKLFEYIQISEYSLHTGIYVWILSFVSFPEELDWKHQQRYFTWCTNYLSNYWGKVEICDIVNFIGFLLFYKTGSFICKLKEKFIWIKSSLPADWKSTQTDRTQQKF